MEKGDKDKIMSLDEKTIQEILDAYEENGQTVQINDGHVYEN